MFYTFIILKTLLKICEIQRIAFNETILVGSPNKSINSQFVYHINHETQFGTQWKFWRLCYCYLVGGDFALCFKEILMFSAYLQRACTHRCTQTHTDSCVFACSLCSVKHAKKDIINSKPNKLIPWDENGKNSLNSFAKTQLLFPSILFYYCKPILLSYTFHYFISLVLKY